MPKDEKVKDYFQCEKCKIYFKPENIVKLHPSEEAKVSHVCFTCFDQYYKHK